MNVFVSIICLTVGMFAVTSAHSTLLGSFETGGNYPFDSNDVVGTGAVVRSITNEHGNQKNVDVFPLLRSRRSAHFGLGLAPLNVRPVYVQPAVQPVAIAPQPIPYQSYHQYQVQPRTVITNPNSQSQSQAISASFGNNQLNGGGGSSISAAAASSSGGGGNTLLQHLRK